MAELNSKQHRLVREYRQLARGRHRKKTGKLILEGAHLLREALNGGVTIDAVLYTELFRMMPGGMELLERLGSYTKRYLVTESLFNEIAHTENPQGVGAIARIPRFDRGIKWEQEELFMLILDRVQDPGNLGAIIRSAAAAPVDGLLLLSGTADPTNPKVLRAAMGGSFYLPLIHERDFPGWADFFKQFDICIIAADPGGKVPYYDLDYRGKTALAIGNESRGLSTRMLQMATTRAYIPLGGEISSLNAAVAAALFIFERQKRIYKKPTI